MTEAEFLQLPESIQYVHPVTCIFCFDPLHVEAMDGFHFLHVQHLVRPCNGLVVLWFCRLRNGIGRRWRRPNSLVANGHRTHGLMSVVGIHGASGVGFQGPECTRIRLSHALFS